MTKKENDQIFVNIAETDELKRSLLESSRDIVEILKNYERYKSANTEKKKEIENLRLKVKQISRLFSNLKSSLPTVKSTILNTKTKEKATPAQKKIEKVLAKEEPKTEIDRLNEELNEIEAKLNTLS